MMLAGTHRRTNVRAGCWISLAAALSILAACARPTSVPVALDDRAAVLPPPPPETSRIFVSAFVPMAAMADVLNTLPEQDAGTRGDAVGDPVRDDKLTWNFTRSPIQTSGANDALHFSSSISGTVRVKGYVQLIRGSLGKILGKQIPFSAHADLAGDVRGEARPELTSNWRLQPNVNVDVDVRQANIPIPNVGMVSVRTKVREGLEPKLASFKQSIEQKFADNTFLEEAGRKLRAETCAAHELEIDDEKAWLTVTPRSFEAVQPSVANDGMKLGIGLNAQAILTMSAEAPSLDCPAPNEPLGPLTILSEAPKEGIALSVPIRFEYESLAKLLDKALAHKVKREEGGAESFFARIEGVEKIEPDGDSLRAELRFRAGLGRSNRAQFEGLVAVNARPVYDPSSKSLLLIEPTVIKSESPFWTDEIGIAAAPLLQNIIKESYAFSLESEIEAAKSSANVALTAFAESLREKGLIATAELQSIDAAHVWVGPDVVEVRVRATGSVSVVIENLGFSP